VLSDKDIDALFADSKTPFSKEEFNAFIRDPGSRARETLERVHYHNHALCNAVVQWKEYRECIGARPSQSILLLLTPGYGGANDARANLEFLADFFSKYPHGALPRWPIISWMSRTSFTLLETLDSFHRTSHLLAARRHLSDFIDLLIYKGEPLLPRDEFAERLHDSKEAFLGECERNAAELDGWLHESRTPTSGATAKPSHHYKTRRSITIPMAAKITGLSESTIKRLDNDPKNTNYPGRNTTAKMLAAWAALRAADKIAAAEVRAANRPLLGNGRE